ncbi:MAG: phosphodiester glycosidase family protein [Pseudonocardia sp.]|nr:phosphodiester glycosidase family protein [Pseudonocardia sp.]
MWRAFARSGVLSVTLGLALSLPGAGPEQPAVPSLARAEAVAPAASTSRPPPEPTPPPGTEGSGSVLAELTPARSVAPGVSHREFTTTHAAGQATGDVVEVDLSVPGVRLGLLTAGAVSARASVPAMADRAGAQAAINGDYFDLGRSNAPAGPEVQDGRPVKSAVPQGRRAAPAVPGAETDIVFAVGTDGVARIDTLPLVAEVQTPGGTLPVQALNQHAVPVGGIGIVTPEWGGADRATTLCGSDTDRNAPCAPDTVEVATSGGKVTAVRPPGKDGIGPGETLLLGREQGAAALRALKVGDDVDVRWELVPRSGVAPRTAVGGSPILIDGARTERLDDTERAPRSAVGIGDGGRRVQLVTVDGRESTSVGVTLAQMSDLLAQLGATDGLNLDGGGSSTLAYAEPGAGKVSVVNNPSDDATRLVPNGLGVFGG